MSTATSHAPTLDAVADLCRANDHPVPDRKRLDTGRYPHTRPAGPTSETGVYVRTHTHDWIENGALVNDGFNPGWNPTFECWCGSVIVDLHVDARAPITGVEPERAPLDPTASAPLCEWIGTDVPAVAEGETVVLCTKRSTWQVETVHDGELVTITPGPGMKPSGPITVHRAHLQVLPAEPHGLVGPCRIRLDVPPAGMAFVLCACGATHRDEAAHARHAARRAETGCDCTSGCPHPAPSDKE